MTNRLSDMGARLRAFGIHLTGSMLLAALGLIVVYRVWYPAPLDVAVGVTHIFLLMLGVDVILGPLLTLIVYKKGKKSLRFDLGVILAVQLAAFVYGMHTVASGRPVWLVFSVDRFDVVRAYEVDERALAQAAPEFRRHSWTGPRWAAAQLPDDRTARSVILAEAMAGGPDLAQRPPYDVSLDRMRSAILARIHPLDRLVAFNDAESVKRVAQAWPQADGWLPLMSNARPMTVLMRRETGQIIAIVELAPWS